MKEKEASFVSGGPCESRTHTPYREEDFKSDPDDLRAQEHTGIHVRPVPSDDGEFREVREIPSKPVRVPVGRGLYALVSPEDLTWISRYRWTLKTKTGDPRLYAQRSTWERGKRATFAMHREVVRAKRGQIVDHINGDSLDNRRENLRLCTARENATNVVSSKNQKRGGFKGVAWNKNAAKWEAYIAAGEVRQNGKRRRLYLGLHRDAASAARAYDAAAREHFGEFAALNFPDAAQRGNEPGTLAALRDGAEALAGRSR